MSALHEREFALMSPQTDGDLRLQPPAEPRLAEPVPRTGLEIQSRHAGKDQPRLAQPGTRRTFLPASILPSHSPHPGNLARGQEGHPDTG